MFYLGEYVHTVTVAAIAVTLFLGGWRGPHSDFLPWLWPLLWFLLKVTLVIYVLHLVRGTLPRMRYDRLMNFGWKVLIPFGLVWVLRHGRRRRASRTLRTLRRVDLAIAAVILGRASSCSSLLASCAAVHLDRERPEDDAAAERSDAHERSASGAPTAAAASSTGAWRASPKGMGTVWKQTFRRDNTEQYPKEIVPPPERSHIGRHLLNTHENGLEKCIGCELCAFACPADAIWVEGADNDPRAPGLARASATRRTTRSTTCAASCAASASRRARPGRSR